MDPKKMMEQKLAQMGYVHPENSNNNRSEYMCYNNNSVYTKSSNQGGYRTESDAYKNTSYVETEKYDPICPICKEKALYECECTEFQDMMCSKGHYWYTKNGQIQLGDPHKQS